MYFTRGSHRERNTKRFKNIYNRENTGCLKKKGDPCFCYSKVPIFLHKSSYLGPVSMGKIVKLIFLTKNFSWSKGGTLGIFSKILNFFFSSKRCCKWINNDYWVLKQQYRDFFLPRKLKSRCKFVLEEYSFSGTPCMKNFNLTLSISFFVNV